MAGRKTFTSGEILTAADVNSFLMDQSVMVFADSTARGSAIPSPSEGMTTYLQDVDQVQVYDGSQFRPVGSVLQVVSTTKTDTFSASLSEGAFTDLTGLTATITPSSTASKIMIFATVHGSVDASGDSGSVAFKLRRDSTDIFIGDSAGSRARVSSGIIGHDAGGAVGIAHIEALDAPASTSSISYSVQVTNAYINETATVYVNRPVDAGDVPRRFRTVSSISVMEVAG